MQLSPDERTVWVCGSFGPPLLLVLAIVVTRDGFVATDKYLMVVLLLGAIPLLGALALARPRIARFVTPGLAMDVLRFNLFLTLLGSLWIGAAAVAPTIPQFKPVLLSIVYLTGSAAVVMRTVLSSRRAEGNDAGAFTIVLIGVAPVSLVASTVVPADWFLTRPFDTVAGLTGALVSTILLLVWRSPWNWPRKNRIVAWIAVVVMVAAPLAMLDVELDYDTLHYTAYLGPSAAISAGRIPLIDVFAQYGQAYLLYNLGFILLPWTYHSAALVTAIANVAYTLCFLLILRRMVRHHLAFVVLGATLPFLFWLIYHYSPNMTPSQGGMRYLPVAVLATVLVWLPQGRLFSLPAAASLCLCWAWSFEAALYGTIVCLAFAVTSAACGRRNPGPVWVEPGRAVLRLFGLLVLFAVVVSAAYVGLFRQLPRYDLYVSMILAYVGPDPFMEYSFYKEGFLGWVTLVVAIFVVVCLVAKQCIISGVKPNPLLPRFVVIGALLSSLGVYCLISTQPFIMKVSLLPAFVLLYAAMERAIEARPAARLVGVSEIGLAPVLVLVAFLLSGVAVAHFSGPPVYASANTSLLRHLLSEGRPFRGDFVEHLRTVCNPPDQAETGSLCADDPNMPATHYQEFTAQLAKWQADDPSLLMFHPMDAVVSASLGKPHVLPVSFAYTDGFSPTLFRDILARAKPVIENTLHIGQTLVLTKDLASLNELQWALLKLVAAKWALEQIDETEHFRTYRLLDNPTGARGPLLVLPDRPVKSRNGL